MTMPLRSLHRVIGALDRLGLDPEMIAGRWRSECPSCSSPHSLWIDRREDGKVSLSCRDGCAPSRIAEILIESGAHGVRLAWGDFAEVAP
jgi:hypothetical protein